MQDKIYFYLVRQEKTLQSGNIWLEIYKIVAYKIEISRVVYPTWKKKYGKNKPHN